MSVDYLSLTLHLHIGTRHPVAHRRVSTRYTFSMQDTLRNSVLGFPLISEWLDVQWTICLFPFPSTPGYLVLLSSVQTHALFSPLSKQNPLSLSPSPYITLSCLLFLQSGAACQESERFSVCTKRPGKGALRTELPGLGPKREVFKLCVSPMKNQELGGAASCMCQYLCVCVHALTWSYTGD